MPDKNEKDGERKTIGKYNLMYTSFASMERVMQKMQIFFFFLDLPYEMCNLRYVCLELFNSRSNEVKDNPDRYSIILDLMSRLE